MFNDMAVLYTGTDPSNLMTEKSVIHCPLIKIEPRSFDEPSIQAVFDDIPKYTHIVFTSKNAVDIFCDFVKSAGFTLSDIHGTVIAVGQATAKKLKHTGIEVDLVAAAEHQEGIVEELQLLDLQNAYMFLPRSSRSRPVIESFLIETCIRHQTCDLYDTVVNEPKTLPDLNLIDEIIFTSPSTVLAFLQIFSAIPKDKKITATGPVTEKALLGVLNGTKI